jgi:predicted house-cleaning noncanonical NTP pyrophosphatase (MazG superfamily)
MKQYNKLIRDKIPDIIKNNGNTPIYHILSQEEYLKELDRKLKEEVKEYIKDKSLEELADVLEVLRAICMARGYTLDELEKVRNDKVQARGEFKDKIYLEYVE